MEEKLNILLGQIHLEDEYFNYFINAKLERIIGNRNKDTYQFIIDIENVLPLNLYLHFNNLVKESFVSIKNTLVSFNCSNYNEQYIRDYYEYFLDIYATDAPLLEMFKEYSINLSNNILNIEVSNKAEIMKFDSIKAQINF